MVTMTSFLVIFLAGILIGLYFEHRFISDMKMLGRYLLKELKKGKEKK